MTIVHRSGSIGQVTDWTEQINNIDNRFGLINDMNMFQATFHITPHFTYDFIENETAIIEASNRRANNHTVGKDDDITTYSFVQQFYNHHDYITTQDIIDQRRPGYGDEAETRATVMGIKLTRLREAMDQTHEYLQLRALTGVLPTGASTTTDMYTLLGLTRSDFTVDLESETASTNLDQKISQVKRMVAAGNRSGNAIVGVDFILDDALFDEIKGHSKFREIYLNYSNAPKPEVLRDDIARYFKWGVSDFFEWQGIRFINYNPDFATNSGVDTQVFSAGTGVAIPRGSNIFRAAYGPSNKLPDAGNIGQRMFSFQWMDNGMNSETVEVQSSVLYWCAKPEAIIQLT